MEFKKPSKLPARKSANAQASSTLEEKFRRARSTPERPRAPRRATTRTPQPPASRAKRPENQEKSIEINIDFESLLNVTRLIKSRILDKLPLDKIRVTRRRVVLAIVPLLLVGGLVWFVSPKPGTPPPNPADATYTKVVQAPNYPTLLPEGRTLESLGGWHRISPPDRNPVFAYADKIGDTSISVSQQPIPDGFKTNIGESVAELAKSYAATEKISLDSLTIYIGTSAKGPQSVILAKGSVLILIKSKAKIKDDAWVSYILSLNRENVPSTTY